MNEKQYKTAYLKECRIVDNLYRVNIGMFAIILALFLWGLMKNDEVRLLNRLLDAAYSSNPVYLPCK